MAEKNKLRLWILISVLAVLVLCVGSIIVSILVLRNRDVNARPLVLIHKPVNHTKVEQGDVVTLHATGRSSKGIKSMQFWVDDLLIAEKQSGNADQANMMHSDVWQADWPGKHVVIAKAVSKNGVEGQASISVEVVAADGGELTHTVGEGETLTSIAEEYGTSPEALSDANPGLGEEGDELLIPGSGPSEEPSDALESDEPPPLPEDDPPGSTDSMMDLLGLEWSDFYGGMRGGAPVGLRLELIELTADAYERLYCYISMGLSPARWYPDTDSNQSTDESFELIGERNWNVSPHFAADSAPVVFWPQNEPLNARVECVGITDVGTDALELGVWEDSIPPERWTGIPLSGGGSGADGSFSFQYRIERVSPFEDVIPAYLDPDMTPPTNARLDEDARRLRWDYEPAEDEEPIHGFRIYLNNNLQWVEPADSLATIMPHEWFNPPCGSRYIFSVTAFRYGIPDGPESLPAVDSVFTAEEGCNREIEISFLTLETFDLGGDGDEGNFFGDVGPIYGDFIANESSIYFSGGSFGAGLDRPAGFEHNTLYDLADMWRGGWWGFTERPTLTVDVPPDGVFGFSYIINDRDEGRYDDVLCDGYSMEYAEDALDRVHEGTLRSDNGRCELRYRFGPGYGSPVGTGETGEEPLPWLDITNMSVDETSGLVIIDILNSGTADWPGRDLQVELQNREGESLGIFTWTEFILETGEATFISQPRMTIDPPFDVCALIDPHDLVPEYGEAAGAVAHTPYCPEPPDLSFVGISFDPSGDELRVMVENLGGAFENRTVDLTVNLSDGSPTTLSTSYPDTSFEAGERRSIRLVGISDAIRATLADGYTIIIDEANLIHETNEDNNRYDVAARLLDVCWCDSFIPHYPPHYRGIGSSARMWLTADVISAETSRTVATRERSSTLEHNETYAYGYNHTWDQGHSELLFSCSEQLPPIRILDDEALRVSVEAEFVYGDRGGWDDIGVAYLLLTPEDFPWIPASAEQCADNRHYRFYVRPTADRYDHADWFTVLSVGQSSP